MAEKLNFTKKELELLPLAQDRFYEVQDGGGSRSRPDLWVRIGKQSKVFYFVRWVVSKTERVKIGPTDLFSVEQARDRAKQISRSFDDGKNPNDDKKAKRQRGLTFNEVVEQYISSAQERADKPLRDSTAANYRGTMKVHFSVGAHKKREGGKDYAKPGKGWAEKQADSITDTDAQKWYQKAVRYSVSSANSGVRAAKTAYAHQIEVSRKQKNTLFFDNPFASIKMVKENPAEDYIEPSELTEWWAAVDSLSNTGTRDYLRLVLLTGLRRREAAALTWGQIDLNRKRTLTLSADQTKNGEKLVLPLSDYLIELLAERRAAIDGDFVFPSTGKSGHLTEPKKAISSVNYTAGTYATVHGLRRTYSNICQWEVGMPDYARKRLLNHSVGNDVTDKHYTNLPLDRLRIFQQKTTDKILELAGVDRTLQKVRSLEAVK